MTYPLTINYFMTGGNAMAAMVISFFFFRFYRKVHDRFFLYFSFAFLAFAMERIVIVVGQVQSEYYAIVYSFRLAAFIIIILAILDKNRVRN